jgi:hypothetical protein
MRAHEFVTENKKVFKRNARTGKLSMKWRCASGPRKGRIVAEPNQCSASLDREKSSAMKLTRAKTKVRQARKAKRTKRLNPAAKLAAKLNKYR